MLSNTLGRKFCYLKVIHILHSRYHPKILGHVLKISKRTSMSYSWDLRVRVLTWKKGPSNEFPALSKRMNLEIWACGTLNQLFIRGS